VLIVGHGTREPRGREGFFELFGEVHERLRPLPVAGCFLELAEPTIGQAVGRLLENGVRRITVAPLMRFAAGHVRRDVPRAVAEAIDGRADVELYQVDHLGCAPRMLALSQKRFDEAVLERPVIPPRETVLVLVGRGASHESAVAEMRQLTELRRGSAPAEEVRTAFLAMAQPRLSEVLADVARRNPRRVVVQAHLLFEGRLMERVRQHVARAAGEHPGIDWVVTGPLGTDELLTERLVEAVGCRGERICGQPAAVSCRVAGERVQRPVPAFRET
jgi:sirohydrochlorin cobaltochelatase